MKTKRCPKCNTKIPKDCDICIGCWHNLPLDEQNNYIPSEPPEFFIKDYD